MDSTPSTSRDLDNYDNEMEPDNYEIEDEDQKPNIRHLSHLTGEDEANEQYKKQSSQFLDGSLSFNEYQIVLEEAHYEESEEQRDMLKTKPATERKRRRFLPPALSGLMGQANLCFAKGDHDSALKMCLEIIRQVPTAPEPFQTLSELYEEKKDKEKSLQFAMIAAYLNPKNPEQWINLGERSLQLNKVSEALTCYTKAVKLDPNNVSSHVIKAKLHDDKGDRKGAIKAYHKLIEIIKPEYGVQIMEYAKLVARYYHEDHEIQKAREVMDIAFSKVTPNLISSEDVNLYLELLIMLKEYIKSLEIISKYCDVKIEAEEDIIADSSTNQLSCSSFRVLSCEVPPLIPIQIRVKLTVTLIHLKSCNLLNTLLAPFLEDENVEQTGDLYIDVVEALMSEGMYVDALKLLKLLVDSKNYSQAAVWLNYAECLRTLGRPEEAISAYLMVMQQAPTHVEARFMVSELLNDLGRSDEAISVLTQDPEAGSLDAGLLYERCMLLKENKERSEEFLAVGRLLMSRHCVRIKGREDLQPLSKLKGYVRKQEALRKMNDEQPDFQEPNLVEGKKLPIADEEWKLFLALCNVAFETKQYGLLQRLAFSALGSAVLNINERREYEVFIIAIYSCLFNKDSSHGYNLVRDLILNDVDNPKAWNLFNVIISTSEDTRHYKFIMRQLARRQMHPALTMIHANNFFITGTYKYALSEYLSAFKHEENPILALMIAITMLQMACQKFSDLKNSLVTQGVAFLWKYRELRGENNLQEVHYNMGRFYHQLGMLSSAIYHYKQGLKLNNPLASDYGDLFDLKREIALNLSVIYQSSGALELARYYTEKYIVI